MALTVRNQPVYVLASVARQVIARNLPVYVLASLRLPLAKGKPAVLQLVDQIRALATVDLEDTELTLSQVLTSAGNSEQNTSVVATASGGDIAKGDATFYYNRRPLIDMVIGKTGVVLDVNGLVNTHQVLDQLIAVTGVLLEVTDIVNQPLVVNNNQVTLTAGAGSFFFVPGSQITIATA